MPPAKRSARPHRTPLKWLRAATVAVLAIGGAAVLAASPAAATTPPSTGCNAANAGAYDAFLDKVGGGPNNDRSVDFATLNAGERLVFSGDLAVGDASAALTINDTTASANVMIVNGPTPALGSVVYTVPANGLRTFQYLLEADASVFADALVTVVCLDGDTPPSLLTLTKEFTDDPVVPGGTVTLEFNIQNQLLGTVTDIAFTDDLDGVLSGLAATDTPKAACGGTLSGTSSLSLTGGTLAGGASCTFSVTLAIPTSAFGGNYVNTTSSANGMFSGTPIAGNAASDTLVVNGPAPGSITIVKKTVGGDGTFVFTSPSLGGFTLTTVGGTASTTFSDLTAGTYAVTEADPGDFDLTALSCDDGSSTDLGTRTATIDLGAGEHVTCTFTNTKPGSITIAVVTDGGDGSFDHTGDLGSFAVTTVGGAGSQGFSGLSPGIYAVTAAPNAAFILAGIVCENDTDGGTVITFALRLAEIDLDGGEAITCTFLFTEVVEHTSAIIENFLQNRANVIVGVGPEFEYLLGRFNGTADNNATSPEVFAYQAMTQRNPAFDALIVSPDMKWAFWVKGSYDGYREGGVGMAVGGRVLMFQAGADYLAGEHVLLGAMVVADAARERSTDLGYQVRGFGFMVGPYVALRFGDAVTFDAKVLWGRSWNDIQPFLTYTDRFTTSRWLITARLAGEADLGPLLIRPEVALSYFRETQHQYVDSNGITIPAQTIALGRLTFGPEIAVPLPLALGGTVTPSLSLHGIWDFTTPRLYAGLDGGIRIVGADGASFQLNGGYAGLFVPTFHAWNVTGRLTIPVR